MRGRVLTVFGVASLTFMMAMLERRGPVFVLAFAVGCALSSAYGFTSGAWPFGVVEAIWAISRSGAGGLSPRSETGVSRETWPVVSRET